MNGAGEDIVFDSSTTIEQRRVSAAGEEVSSCLFVNRFNDNKQTIGAQGDLGLLACTHY